MSDLTNIPQRLFNQAQAMDSSLGKIFQNAEKVSDVSAEDVNEELFRLYKLEGRLTEYRFSLMSIMDQKIATNRELLRTARF